jgi:hypothetical protein
MELSRCGGSNRLRDDHLEYNDPGGRAGAADSALGLSEPEVEIPMASGRVFSARIAIAALLLGAAPAAVAGPDSLERAVKATYLYKLAAFVNWPANAPQAPTPLAICVQGADPFGPVLDRVVAGRRIAGRPVVVRRLLKLEADSGCAIAYVSGSAAQTQAQALAAVEKAPVLTVTDAERGQAKGIVHLVPDGGKVRFSIDAAQAQEAGLEISSKLLALAVAVGP